MQDRADDITLINLKCAVERRVGNLAEHGIFRGEECRIVLKRSIDISLTVGSEELSESGQVPVTSKGSGWILAVGKGSAGQDSM